MLLLLLRSYMLAGVEADATGLVLLLACMDLLVPSTAVVHEVYSTIKLYVLIGWVMFLVL